MRMFLLYEKERLVRTELRSNLELLQFPLVGRREDAQATLANLHAGC